MKISKVDHVKSGIDQKISGQRGMLYKQPERKYDGDALEKHVRNLNSKASYLYRVFPGLTEKKHVNKFMKETILSQLRNGKSVQDIEKSIISYHASEQISNECIQDLVDQNLKESLRKYTSIDGKKIYIPEVIAVLLKAKLSTDGKQDMPDPEQLKAVIEIIKEDYLKENQIKKIVNSIENNSTPIQVCEKNGQKRLILSSAENPKKAYIFNFMKEYASFAPMRNERGKKPEKRPGGEQGELLRHMRYLILLYYYGPEQITADYEDEEIKAWSFGSIIKETELLLSDAASHLIQEREQKRANKAEYRKLGDDIKRSINESIVQHYQNACKAVNEKDVPWIKYISNHAMSVFSQKNKIDPSKLSLSYLAKNTWNTWVSYIAMKYVDMGKGVYHFAMSELDKVGCQDKVVIGQVNPNFANGISSFDYERIKAEDDLHRNMSGYITFAVENFAKAVYGDKSREKKGQEDILTSDWNLLEFDDNVKKRMLQYFGGASNFSESPVKDIETKKLAACIKENLYAARNINFHFAGSEAENRKQNGTVVLEEIIKKETDDVGKYYRKTFYSNNVTAFYGKEDITELMDHLYQKEKSYQAQIPSFNKVISKTYLPVLIFNFIKGKNRVKISAPEEMTKFSGALYFVMKEIYYNSFLQDPDLKERFRKGLENVPKDEKNKEVYKNFMQRFCTLEEMKLDFGEICQQIMTDYELQNKEKKKVATPKKVGGSDKKKQKYKHFRTLLYIGLREAFIAYLRDEENKEWYEFLREPKKREQTEENAFVNEWKLEKYSDRLDLILKENATRAWYIAAHFINQAQLNHLIGDIKNYIQFIQDIDRRARSTGNRVSEQTIGQTEQYKRILQVLEFTKFFCGQTTNCLSDYYQDEEGFALHVGHYVNFTKKNTGSARPSQELQGFCNSSYTLGKEKKKAGVYYDGMNPIPNRNIILASLYGNKKLLENTMNPVTELDFKKYYELKARLDPVFKRDGVCETKDEQEGLRQFQNIKNRIELVDVLTLSELVNDLMAQLIGWAYIRERDMMYFQLGLYYIKLYYTDSISADSYLRTLKFENGSIADGAVLYQIASMYSFDLPIYVKQDTDGVAFEQKVKSVGEKFGVFETQYCKGDNNSVIENGLCLFENVAQHVELVKFRNYLDHFKYYARLDNSILDLYSVVYDSFFSYNIKLKKSVSYVLTNILLSYFIDVKLKFSSYRNENSEKEKKTVRNTNISIDTAQSDNFTYKLKKIIKKKNGMEAVENDNSREGEIRVSAREKTFVEEVVNILQYKSGN